ncbi:MFS transporter [Streptomyces sp. NPDC049881]|uniref:MFS transporter n=1 Tax=Streptomyces sp. NPDC049881 TaxID=3155778 RepID=UPI00342DF9BD
MHTAQLTPPRSPFAGWAAVGAVTAGIFALVTSEILPIGLLTAIGADLGVSDGTAGLMMTMPGLLAAVSAPLVTVATARTDRRVPLCAFALLLAVADFLTAVAPGFGTVLVARVLVGVTIGGFWSVGAGLARRLVPAASAGRATAVVFAAVPLGSVLGVPLGTLIGDAAGWRTAFAVMGCLSAGVLAALCAALPPLPPERATDLRVLAGLLRTSGTRYALLVTFLVVLAHFGAYTYVGPFLEEVTGMGGGQVTAALFLYGAAGIAGPFAGGALAARRPHTAMGAAAGAVAAAALLLPLVGRWPVGAVVLLVVWGAAYGAVPVCSQTWFARAAPHAVEASSVVFTASFQGTMACAALAGGVAVDRWSPSAVMVLGGVTAVLALLVVRAHHGLYRRVRTMAG